MAHGNQSINIHVTLNEITIKMIITRKKERERERERSEEMKNMKEAT